ncbi:Berardinelli-Seip congenital lipodystrophy 2 (seipin) [Boothiomyces macroporosus]|uniref:Berardinelli-Seip congenital lipodystrophy 2 (Seipin) n=1 Tax=Boothiomyces macroporosus TaxID=261099 RepID=A0AAD5UL15_9FUNG|nr:Berardinelli-Seip congenital lipodystrophy 2 (seipin) [Boothiomyces macroporosus]
MDYLGTLKSAFDFTKEKAIQGYEIFLAKVTSRESQKVMVSSVVLGSTIAVLLISSIFIYILIYIISMPVVSKQVPIYLDYTGYNLAVDLTVPETDYNLMLGNFMVTMELTGKHNQSLVKSTRPQLRLLSTFYNSFSLLTGRALESQNIRVDLIENFQELSSNPVRFAHVEISTPIQTYASHLVINTHFQGLAYFMHHWWLTTAVFFITSIMLSEILVASYIWNIILAYYEKMVYPPQIEQSNETLSENVTATALEEEIEDTVERQSNISYSEYRPHSTGNFSYPYKSDVQQKRETVFLAKRPEDQLVPEEADTPDTFSIGTGVSIQEEFEMDGLLDEEDKMILE